VINKLVQRNLLLQEKLDKYVDYETIKQKVEELTEVNTKIYSELLSSKKGWIRKGNIIHADFKTLASKTSLYIYKKNKKHHAKIIKFNFKEEQGDN